MFSSKPYTFDRVFRMLMTVVILFAVLYLIYILRDVLLPFVVACLGAYIFEPFVQYNRRILKLKGRAVAVFVTLFEITTILALALFLFGPSILSEMSELAVMLQQYAEGHKNVTYLPDGVNEFIRKYVDLEAIASKITLDDVHVVFHKIFSFMSGGVSVIVGFVEWIFSLLYLVFIMLDYDKLMTGFKKIVPAKYRKPVFRLGNDIKRSMNLYFRGQALIAFIVAIIYSIGFSIVGLPLAIVLGIMIGFLFMVPYLQFVSLVPVTFLCIVLSTTGEQSFWSLFRQCIAVYAFVQIVADVILTPKIMGSTMGMNPAIILLSLSIWGSLFGILGMIIALPLTTLIIDYYNRYVNGEK